MRELILKRKFSKDVERIKRTGRDMSRLAQAIDLLAEGQPMPPINRDHALVGDFKGYRECHLGGDWLLLYQCIGKTAVLVRTGSHADLLDL
jgi:mRNA interferase YafQ